MPRASSNVSDMSSLTASLILSAVIVVVIVISLCPLGVGGCVLDLSYMERQMRDGHDACCGVFLILRDGGFSDPSLEIALQCFEFIEHLLPLGIRHLLLRPIRTPVQIREPSSHELWLMHGD